MGLIHTIAAEPGPWRIKFSPDGQLLAVVAQGGQVVTIYDVLTGMKTQ